MKRHTRSLSAGFAVILAVLLIFVSPLALSYLVYLRNDWPLLSNVGQSFGFASAALAGFALIGIAGTLIFQARQTRVSQIESVRNIQMELFRMAYDYPDLQDAWAGGVDLPYPEWRKATYLNLIFVYLRMAFVVGVTSEQELHRTLANRFTSKLGREYWEGTRAAMGTTAGSRKDRVFLRVAEEEYQKAVSVLPRIIPADSTGQDSDTITKARETYVSVTREPGSAKTSLNAAGTVAAAAVTGAVVAATVLWLDRMRKRR